jgi:hypothetical protein
LQQTGHCWRYHWGENYPKERRERAYYAYNRQFFVALATGFGFEIASAAFALG